MAHRSQCSSTGDNPLDPNYLAPHYREEYRLAVDALVEKDLKGYYDLLQNADVVDFLSTPDIQYIQSSVQDPQESNHPEHHFLEGDSSSDTYWPIQSDLDAPGLDLGWPHLHGFSGPTEVTTLINPPAPFMPSIKEQARRLIKNAQQVIAIVMDMFTDVDLFADILNAATRNVAVYLILDKQNAHHFINMVSNCRVNLQSIQFLRVRTVSGITYHCRSGKSIKGQMMDRFLMTDCRAVLSGNYSFMWSFEKLHRCMAHLFLGQLVSTFDEEFRILYAQSQPLVIENVPEDFNPLQKMQYPHEKTSLYRDPWKFRLDDECTGMDWRMMPLKRQESLPNSVDAYSRCSSKHSQMPACSGYDQFWSQDKTSHSADEYSEPGLLQEMEPPGNFDPVLNYLSSTRNVEFDQYSEKLLPASDLPLNSSYPRRLSLGQIYACQTSPTPSNPAVQKKFFQEPNTDHKDAMVKQGLRNLRISSYLSAFDNPGDEGLPLAPPQVPNPLEKPGICFAIPKIPHFRDFKVPALRRASQMPNYVKPNTRELSKELPDESTAVAAETKTTTTPLESSSTTGGDKTEEAKEPKEPQEPKEPKTGVVRREESFRRKYNAAVPRSSRLRSSLLFSSLEQNTSQDTQNAAGQQDEDADKDEAEQTKVPFVSQVLGQRGSSAREPFEWSRYIKSASFDSSAPTTSKPDDGTSKAEEKDSSSKDENSKNPPENPEVQESLKPSDVEQANISTSMPQSKPSEAELPKTDQLVQLPKSLLTPLYVDMSDPDERLMFFKELAAKRKAANAAEAEKSTEKTPMKAPTDLKDNTTVKKEEPVPNETSENIADTSVKKQTTSSEGLFVKTATAENARKTTSVGSLKVRLRSMTKNKDSQVNNDPNTSKSCEKEETRVWTDTPPSLSSSPPESCLPNVSDLESSNSKPDQKEPITPTPTPADPPPEQSETSSLVNPDIPPDASRSETSACPQDAPTQANSPSEHNLTISGTPTPAETVSCSSPLSESVGSVISPEAEKTETNMPVLHRSSDTNSLSSETPTDSNKAPTHPSIQSSSSPTKPTSIVTSVTTEPDLPSKTPESVTSESHTSESPVPADNSNMDNQIEVSKEHELPEPFEEKNEDTEATSKVNNSTTKESNYQARQNNCSEVAEVASDKVVPPSQQSKKPKSTQSRYHSSTAKVLSSSNLRDDTKLLLGQISANSQSRNELTKGSPVTDDEKEDKADKNAKRAKERGIRLFGRKPPKSAQERKEMLEKIQSMRKDKKVYSRFEMAP